MTTEIKKIDATSPAIKKSNRWTDTGVTDTTIEALMHLPKGFIKTHFSTTSLDVSFKSVPMYDVQVVKNHLLKNNGMKMMFDYLNETIKYQRI